MYFLEFYLVWFIVSALLAILVLKLKRPFYRTVYFSWAIGTPLIYVAIVIAVYLR